jgi:nitroimidazol reductase NimA-like FMN-containing flavoprotein (pyridoxamine 5'-phosphate oxidase superfamily)
MIGELNHNQINNVLSSQAIGRIACSDGKQPYIIPVTYAYDGKYIYGQVIEGMKLKLLRKNPKVCFEIDIITNMANWQSVLVYGIFEELKNTEAKKAREFLFDRVFPLMTSSTVHPFGHEQKEKVNDDTRIKPVMYRIKISKITGRFEKQ